MKAIQVNPEAIGILEVIRQHHADPHGKPASYSFAVIELNRLRMECNKKLDQINRGRE